MANKTEEDMKHGGKAHKKMKHGGKAHKEDMMYGGGAGMTKKKKKGMMGGGKMYASMNNRYAHGGKVYPSKGKI